MPRKQKRVPWSAAHVQKLKSMAQNKKTGDTNRKSAQAYRVCYASKGIQYRVVSRLSRMTQFINA